MSRISDSYSIIVEIEVDELLLKASMLYVDLYDVLEIQIEPLFDVESIAVDFLQISTDTAQCVQSFTEGQISPVTLNK